MVASRVRSERQVESVKQYFFQAGYRNGDQFTYTEKIQLNRHLTENVWHRLSLIVDKDSNSTVRIFFDDDYVGSFRESLPPRDVGGVMTLNLYENEALFKKFVVGRCLRFSSAGECKYNLKFIRFTAKKFMSQTMSFTPEFIHTTVSIPCL